MNPEDWMEWEFPSVYCITKMIYQARNTDYTEGM